MAKIQNSDVITEMIKGLFLDPAREQVPSEIADKILAVYQVNPQRLIQVANLDISDGTAGTLITTASDKDTYLIGATISVSKDVVNNGIFSAIDCVPIGNPRRQVLIVNYEPVTASSNLNAQIAFPLPIKLTRGSSVRILNGSGTASIDTAGTIMFYEVDPQ